MSNAVFPLFKQAMATGAANVALNAGTIRATIVDLADYTYNAAHDFINDVPVAARVATAQLTNPTVGPDGTFDADDPNFGNVTGDQGEAVIIWKDTGNEATSRLVAFLDTGVLGLPVTPGGGPIAIVWDPTGIFSF